MEFLKKLNEEYRLFHIDDENHSITEIPLEDILDQGEPESDEDEQPEDDIDVDFEPESGEDEIDFSQFDDGDEDGEAVGDPSDLEDDAGNAYDLDSENFDDLEHGDDAFQNPETKGETRMDPNLSGIKFGKDTDPDDPENYDTDEYHYPSPEDDHLSSRSANNMAIDTDAAYSMNDTGEDDDQDQSDSDDTEDYSDILGDMDLGSYLAKYAGQGGEGGESELGDEEGQPEDDLGQGEEDLEDEEGGEGEDPDMMGVIRSVQGAALVYKRQQPDNLFTELWVFTSGDDKSVKVGSQIRRAILAGTDINPSTGESESGGDETAETSSVGNVTFIKIEGLPN